MVGSLLAGFFGGRWLDVRFGTRPWLTLCGLLLGIAAGLLTLIRILRTGGEGP